MEQRHVFQANILIEFLHLAFAGQTTLMPNQTVLATLFPDEIVGPPYRKAGCVVIADAKG